MLDDDGWIRERKIDRKRQMFIYFEDWAREYGHEEIEFIDTGRLTGSEKYGIESHITRMTSRL